MSIVVSKRKFIFATELGDVQVEQSLIKGVDVEDMLANNSISQARNLQFKLLGRDIDKNKKFGRGTIASVYNIDSGDDVEPLL